MESMLGFEETMESVDDKETLSSSNGYKLVPWLSWEEWDSVRESLFSSIDKSRVVFALERISTWRGRGCLPVVIDVTASIIEIQLKDPYYRDQEEQPTDVLVSEQLLAMLYCMAVLRLVNCVVEKTRRKTEVSIAEAATVIGIPRKLIDVRHEGSHRDLPALQVLRDCSDKALHWLKAYYWEPQKKLIPLQRDGIADIRRDIKSKLQELAFCLKVMHSPELGSSIIKGKRGKYYEGLCGRNKFISIMAGKHHSSKTRGSKKKMTKCLKILVELYSSFSSEMVFVLLEFLLEALDSSNLEFQNDSHFVQNMHLSLDDWKPVITRFSIKEPELLLTLLQTVLDMIRSEEANQYETERQNMTSSEYKVGTRKIEHLSYLFAWLVGLLRGLKPCQSTDSAAGNNISNAILVELLRKCLLVVATGNKMLMDSVLQVAQLLGNTSLVEKLNKLSSIYLSHTDDSEEISSLLSTENLLIQQEDFILQAAKKLELVKHQRMKSKVVKTADGNVGTSNRWVVARSWNSCPIGMLPRDLGSSGRLPVLDCENSKQRDHEQSERKETWELNRCTGKREATCNIQLLDNSTVKKMKNTVDADSEEVSLFEEVKGHLMIGGVWKKVGDEELQAIKSGIRVLV